MPVQILDLGSNLFSGNLSVIEGMPIATEFRFDGNALTGSMPRISPNTQVRHFLSPEDARCPWPACHVLKSTLAADGAFPSELLRSQMHWHHD